MDVHLANCRMAIDTLDGHWILRRLSSKLQAYPMVSSRSAIAVRTASAGSQIRGRSEGSTTFIRGCAKGFSASLASPSSAADLTATLASSNARSPAWHFPPLLWMFHKAVCNYTSIIGTMQVRQKTLILWGLESNFSGFI